MNLVSFVDELVKVGALDCMYKRADDADITTSDIPHAMMNPGPTPPAINLVPDEAATRLPLTAALPSVVGAGLLGDVTSPRNPVDRPKFNRVFR